MVTRRCVSISFAIFLTMLFVGPARALSVRFVWRDGVSAGPITGLGTNQVAVSNTDPATLTLDIEIGVGPEGLGAWASDIEFDVGPDFDDELDVVSTQELSWGNAKANRTLKPLAPGLASSQESGGGGPEGQLFGFDLYSLGTGATNVTLTFARVVFVTNPLQVQSDGLDIFTTNERDPFSCHYGFSFGCPWPPLLQGPLTAEVNLIPEPTSLVLLGLGLAALATARRRR